MIRDKKFNVHGNPHGKRRGLSSNAREIGQYIACNQMSVFGHDGKHYNRASESNYRKHQEV